MWQRALAIAVLLGGCVGVAHAQESLDEIDQSKSQNNGQNKGQNNGTIATSASTPTSEPHKVIAEVNGYVDNRFQYSYIDPNATPVSTINQPSLQEILEGNIQLKINLNPRAFIYADVSLIYQNGWLYYDRDGMGGRVSYPDHDVAALHPFVVTSELYATYSPRPWINFLIGKKRIIWGSGFAFNPTDLINPPKDPTDPNFQRAGQWVARVELPFEKFTISTLFAPQVLYQTSGIPYAVMKYPSYMTSDGIQPADDSYHYLLAARLYILVFNSDLNFFYFFSNKYNDLFENASRFGGSFSRYFFTDYELHLEALFQVGSSRLYADPLCAAGRTCDFTNAVAASKLNNGTLYPRLLVGGRTQFRDESQLSIEYYYQADGYSDQEFGDFLRVLSRAQIPGVTSTASFTAPSGGTSGALPNRFTFDPLRRHYLILSYTKPKIKDDFTIGAVLIAGLTDLSGTLSPSVSWATREWLSLSLYAFIPIRGIPVGQVTVNNVNFSEYSLLPIDFRLLFEARAFY